VTRAVVIGKFDPPHRGHLHLIRAALAGADEVTVLVCERTDQPLPGALRAGWLREMAPAARVIVIADTLPADDSRAWAGYTRAVLGWAPDLVFTSETYGDAYARHLGARHVLVDLQRRAVPISATQIRRDPLAHWEYLEPCVRAHYAVRVCVLGAESSGTTTLARDLAAHFGTVWVPEFGRLYYEARQTQPGPLRWDAEEFALIAAEQNRLEDALARRCGRLLVCDTDAFATRLWQERYQGYTSAAVARAADGRRMDLYLLTDCGIPFVQDGTRDGAHLRERMQGRFAEELRATGRPFLPVAGTPRERLARAVAACEQLLAAPRLDAVGG
jgi:NadR type nicotinamide-nucleotide adenylyltransferase